ncbi:MAG: serine hydrolase domain-containing protein [Myxococcota bacterium]
MLQGFVHPDFQRVADALRRQLPRSGRGGGAAVCVYHRGEKVVDCWGGVRDEEGSPWEEDTVSLSYSTSKGVASTLMHILVDRGLIDYEDPICEVWPEFAAEGKQDVTLRHLMCHEAGLYDIRSIIDHADRMQDWDYMAEALANARTSHPPGAAHGYHGLTYGWLIGEIVRRLTGKPYAEALESEIAKPLGLDGLFVGLPAHQMRRRAKLILPDLMKNGGSAIERVERYASGMKGLLRLARVRIDSAALVQALIPRGMEDVDFNSEAFVTATIPAANGMFTARSLARMYALLAADGELDGVSLIRRETVWRAAEVQNRGVGKVIPLPMHWRLGYHRVPTFGVRVPNGFGHFGFGGSGAWADPDRNLAVALTLNSGVGTPFGDLRTVRIGTAAARCADRRS